MLMGGGRTGCNWFTRGRKIVSSTGSKNASLVAKAMKTAWGLPPRAVGTIADGPSTISRTMLPSSCDVLIVGAGLAGASAAWHLRQAGYHVVVVNAAGPGAAASGVGAGLANPMMAKKGHPPWRVREALDALAAMPSDGMLSSASGLLRPASNSEQAVQFSQQADLHPDLGAWHAAGEAHERYPFLKAPHGVLEVMAGSAWDLASTALAWLAPHPVVRIGHEWSTEQDSTGVSFHDPVVGSIRAGRVLLCMGDGMRHHELPRTLHLHGIKGQTIRVSRPASLPDDLPPISGGAYLSAAQDGSIWIGSTFEHTWNEAGPTEEASLSLRQRAADMLPELHHAPILEARAGVRVTVPGTRLPMVGPLHPESRIWVMTGFGAKGLLLSALFGREIPAFFNVPEAIPEVCRVVRRAPES